MKNIFYNWINLVINPDISIWNIAIEDEIPYLQISINERSKTLNNSESNDDFSK